MSLCGYLLGADPGTSELYTPVIARVPFFVSVDHLEAIDSEGLNSEDADDLVFDGRVALRRGDERANLYSSLVLGAGYMHAPVIDVDQLPLTHEFEEAREAVAAAFPEVPADLVRWVHSTNFMHCYIEWPYEFEDFCTRLDALAEAGIVQPFFARMTRRRGAAFVRLPGQRKGERVPTPAPASSDLDDYWEFEWHR